MIDIHCVKQAYFRKEINDAIFICSEYNPSDALAMVKTSSYLDGTIRTWRVVHPVEPWIEQNDPIRFVAENESGSTEKKLLTQVVNNVEK